MPGNKQNQVNLQIFKPLVWWIRAYTCVIVSNIHFKNTLNDVGSRNYWHPCARGSCVFHFPAGWMGRHCFQWRGRNELREVVGLSSCSLVCSILFIAWFSGENGWFVMTRLFYWITLAAFPKHHWLPHSLWPLDASMKARKDQRWPWKKAFKL